MYKVTTGFPMLGMLAHQAMGILTLTVIQEIFIQDFFVFVIFMVFNFSFLYWNLM